MQLAWGPHHNHELRRKQPAGTALSLLDLNNASVTISDADNDTSYRAPVGSLLMKADGSNWNNTTVRPEFLDVYSWGPARLEAMIAWLLDSRCTFDVGRTQHLEIMCHDFQPVVYSDAPAAASIAHLLSKMSDALTSAKFTTPWLGQDGKLPANPLVLARKLTTLTLDFQRLGDHVCAPWVLEQMLRDVEDVIPLERLDVVLAVPAYEEDPHLAARWMTFDNILADKIERGLLPRFQKLCLYNYRRGGGEQIIRSCMVRMSKVHDCVELVVPPPCKEGITY